MRRLPRNTGSTIVAALVTLAVLALLAATTFQTVTSRFRSNYQTASWHDALTAAESGVQYSFARLRSPLSQLDTSTSNPINVASVLTDPLKVPGSLQSDLATLKPGGTSTNGTVPLPFQTYNGTPFPSIQLPTLVIPHAGQGSTQFNSVVTIDAVPTTTGNGVNTWYRIRSVGTVPLAGNASVGIQKYDNLLRKLQFRVDGSGHTLSKPQAVRTIEVIAKPITIGSAALFGQTGIDLNNQNVVVDSYDSRYSTTSTNGQYDATKATKVANVVTDDNLLSNGSPGVINLSPTGAYVNGNIATNDVEVRGATDHVSGTITQDFYQSLSNPPDPAKVSSTWTSVAGSTTSLDATAGTQASPTRYKISGSGTIKLSGNGAINIIAPAPSGGTSGPTYYIEIWIPGDLDVAGNGGIVIPSNVHATFYVDGSVKIAGNGVDNTSLKPGNVTLYGNHDPTVSQTMTVDGNGQFAGVIYAPSATVTAKGGGSSGDIYGAIIANSIFFNGGTSLHYDSALGDVGAVIDYRMVSWYEDNALTR